MADRGRRKPIQMRKFGLTQGGNPAFYEKKSGLARHVPFRGRYELPRDPLGERAFEARLWEGSQSRVRNAIAS
jgi:hypothetical protein